MDRIEIRNLKVYAHHGVFPEETEMGQDFFVNATLYVDFSNASADDDLSKSVDYSAVCKFMTVFLTSHTYKLIETAADRMATEILKTFPSIDEIELEIKKPDAPIPLPFECISVHVHKKYHDVYISAGSNLGDRKAHLDYAVFALNRDRDTYVVKHSSQIETAPVGYVDQPDFLNSAIHIKTLLSPEELLEKIHKIESDEKRERVIHWGPRTLDLDILLYDDLVYESDTLCIPHLRMHERSFVLEPLCEIAPNAIHPILHKNIYMLKESLSSRIIL